ELLCALAAGVIAAMKAAAINGVRANVARLRDGMRKGRKSRGMSSSRGARRQGAASSYGAKIAQQVDDINEISNRCRCRFQNAGVPLRASA
ncbi:hypothetical protein, partial [Streptococcus pyogenes]|uniref:hypothetical protein n=1 Tax=Streptococcus pyogenes TaxID=1314 RepID=UPI001C99335E